MWNERGHEEPWVSQRFEIHRCLSLSGESLPAIAEVVHENILTELVEVRIKCPSLVRFGEFVDEIDEVWVAGDHECADDDLLPAALDGLVKCLVDDAGVEAK
jgi:hypothetical protein